MPSSTVLALALALLSTAYLLFKKLSGKADDVSRLPSPPNAHWFWGHEKQAFQKSYPDAYNQWNDELGGAYAIKGGLFHGDILIPTDPSILTHIFSRHVYSYTKSPVFRPLIDRLLGKSIVWAEGEDHRRMHDALAACFTAERVRAMEPAVIESSNKLASTLRKHVLSSISSSKSTTGADEGVLINTQEWPARATLDIIGRVGFNHDFKCGDSPEAKDLFRLWREQCTLGLSDAGFIAPLVLRAFPFITDLPVAAIQAQGAIKLRLRELAGELAREEIAKASDPNAVPPSPKRTRMGKEKDSNLLSSLVRASVQDGKQVSIDELLDHITTFVMVGHETSAGVINYILHALASKPTAQNTLRAELADAGFGPYSFDHHDERIDENDEGLGLGQGREPTYDELMDPRVLPYLDAVAKEGLRLFPSGAHTERVAVKDDVVPLKTPVVTKDGKLLESIRIKKGQLIAVSWSSVNTNSSTWGPDGTVFRPERWLATTDTSSGESTPPNIPNASTGGWQHLGSFSEGPRMCLGYRLALFEIKAILVALIRAIRVEPLYLPSTSGEEREEVKILSTFAATLQPHVVAEQQDVVPGVKMDGPWLPVRVRLVDEE